MCMESLIFHRVDGRCVLGPVFLFPGLPVVCLALSVNFGVHGSLVCPGWGSVSACLYNIPPKAIYNGGGCCCC